MKKKELKRQIVGLERILKRFIDRGAPTDERERLERLLLTNASLGKERDTLSGLLSDVRSALGACISNAEALLRIHGLRKERDMIASTLSDVRRTLNVEKGGSISDGLGHLCDLLGVRSDETLATAVE